MEDLFEQITGQRKIRFKRGARVVKRESHLEARALEDAMGGYTGGRDYGLSGNLDSGSVNADSGWLDLDHEIASERSFGASRKSELSFEDEDRVDAGMEDEEI